METRSRRDRHIDTHSFRASRAPGRRSQIAPRHLRAFRAGCGTTRDVRRVRSSAGVMYSYSRSYLPRQSGFRCGRRWNLKQPLGRVAKSRCDRPALLSGELSATGEASTEPRLAPADRLCETVVRSPIGDGPKKMRISHPADPLQIAAHGSILSGRQWGFWWGFKGG